MEGSAEDLEGRARLHQPARVHHEDPARQGREGSEVVARHEHGEAEAGLQPRQQRAQLGLGGGIEGRGGLIGQQHGRAAGQGLGQHHALPLPSAQLVRIGLVEAVRLVEPDLGEHRQRIVAATAAAAVAVGADHLRHLRAHPAHGIEGQGGLLEDDGDVRPAHAAPLPRVERPEVAAAEADGAAHDARFRRKQPEEREQQRRLAAARFAEEAHDLARVEVEADPVHGHDALAASARVFDGEVPDLEQGHARMIGHAAARRPLRTPCYPWRPMPPRDGRQELVEHVRGDLPSRRPARRPPSRPSISP